MSARSDKKLRARFGREPLFGPRELAMLPPAKPRDDLDRAGELFAKLEAEEAARNARIQAALADMREAADDYGRIFEEAASRIAHFRKGGEA